ncbi:MAG: DUF2442 domain-containing protein [Elstera sp.]
MLLDVVAVKALPEFQLDLTFENGECRRFDMKPLMEKKPFNRLQNNSFFGAHIDYGTVVWPGNIDIAPETLYDLSVPIDAASGKRISA